MDYYDPHYNGTDNWWRHPLYGYIFTDSYKDFCKEYEAYWTMDVLGSYYPQFKKYPFLVIYFDVHDDECDFYIKEDSDQPKIIKQHIPYTDLRVSFRLYYENDVICFPSDR